MSVPVDASKYFCPHKPLAEPFTWIHECQVSFCTLFAISYQLSTAGVTTNHLRLAKLVFTVRLIIIFFFSMKNKIWFWNPDICVFVGRASQCDGKSRNLTTHSPYLVLPSLLFSNMYLELVPSLHSLVYCHASWKEKFLCGQEHNANITTAKKADSSHVTLS